MKETYLAGAAAALTVDILVYPLDTLKTRLQSQDFLAKTIPRQKTLALRGLYQGIGSVVLATLPAAGLFFSTYESAKVLLSRTASSLPEPINHSLASATAEIASCLILAPAEVIKQNAQMVRSGAPASSSSSSLLAFHRLTRSGTARRLFAGYTALVARNLPFTALQFPVFEYTRAQLWRLRSARKQKQGKRGSGERGVQETGLVAGASAAFAGALAALLTTPSDVVKTRMMVQMDPEEKGKKKIEEGGRKRKGVGEVVVAVYREKGVRGFFRGGLFRSGATALGSGLYLGTYDAAKLFLERGKPDRLLKS